LSRQPGRVSGLCGWPAVDDPELAPGFGLGPTEYELAEAIRSLRDAEAGRSPADEALARKVVPAENRIGKPVSAPAAMHEGETSTLSWSRPLATSRPGGSLNGTRYSGRFGGRSTAGTEVDPDDPLVAQSYCRMPGPWSILSLGHNPLSVLTVLSVISSTRAAHGSR
jgi:hypothetical protein